MTTTNAQPNLELPYYGATREEIVALGHDPETIEEGRLASRESAHQARRAEEAQVLVAAIRAVDEGAMLPADVALALHAGGYHVAHDAFVKNWQAEEANLLAGDEAANLSFADASEYAMHHAAQQTQERATQEAEAAESERQLKTRQVEELQADLKRFVESTPGVHQLAPAVERRLVHNLQERGVLPSTPEERAAEIETALKTELVVADENESVRQQVDAEWRIHRKNSGATDGLMTAADIARAEAVFKEARFQQLANARMVDLESLKPGPTADETSAALTDKFRERQEKSTDFRTQVADIEKRGKDATATRDRGEGISEEKARYREAMKRAEEEAHYGNVRTTENAEAEVAARPSGYGPDGTWPDELRPAL